MPNNRRLIESPMVMHTIDTVAVIRREMPASTCPSSTSITPFISGTPGMRNSTLDPMATWAVWVGTPN